MKPYAENVQSYTFRFQYGLLFLSNALERIVCTDNGEEKNKIGTILYKGKNEYDIHTPKKNVYRTKRK